MYLQSRGCQPLARFTHSPTERARDGLDLQKSVWQPLARVESNSEMLTRRFQNRHACLDCHSRCGSASAIVLRVQKMQPLHCSCLCDGAAQYCQGMKY